MLAARLLLRKGDTAKAEGWFIIPRQIIHPRDQDLGKDHLENALTRHRSHKPVVSDRENTFIVLLSSPAANSRKRQDSPLSSLMESLVA